MPSPQFEDLVSKACGLHEPDQETLSQAAFDHRVAVVENLFDRVVLEELNVSINPHGHNPICLLHCYGHSMVIFGTMDRYIIGLDNGERDSDGDECITPLGPVPGEQLQKMVLRVYASMRLRASDPHRL